MPTPPLSGSRGVFYLTLVSVIWAFSFGLIKTGLTGVPSPFLAFIRLGLATLVFLPFLRPRGYSPRLLIFCLGLGSIQYGIMYCLLFSAFQYLQAHEVVLFTLFTPIYVSLLGDLLERRAFRPVLFLSAALAVAGAAVIKANPLESSTWWIGFLYMQGANACFAIGQIAYRRLKSLQPGIKDREVYALLFFGGTLLAGAYLFPANAFPAGLEITQIGIIFYLGIIASGLGFFWWNRGAALVANTGLLAAFNNLSIPLGVLVSVWVFGESADWFRLLGGSAILALGLALALGRSGLQGRQRPTRTNTAPE